MCGPQRPKFGGFWILDFGDFGDFGFWLLGILDFGFWGFWILDFGVWGFWILDFGFCDKFWILHKKKKTVHAEPGRRIVCNSRVLKVQGSKTVAMLL